MTVRVLFVYHANQQIDVHISPNIPRPFCTFQLRFLYFVIFRHFFRFNLSNDSHVFKS